MMNQWKWKRGRWSVRMLAVLMSLMLAIAAGCSDDDAASSNDNNSRNDIDVGPGDGLQDASDAGDEDTSEDHEDAGDEDTSVTDASDADDGTEDADDGTEDVDDGEEDATDPVDGGQDASDAGNEDADDQDTSDAGDTGDVTPAPKGCEGSANTGTTFEIDPTGTRGQASIGAAFDGEGVWVVYTSREVSTDGHEDVFAARVMCDGTIGAGPMRVTTTAADLRDINPAVDVYDDTVYFAWTVEDTDAGNYRTVHYRTYRIDGVELMADSADVTPEDANGDPVSDDLWETDIAALPTGGAAITASYNSPDEDYGHQIVVQRVDDSGNLVGTAIDAYSDAEARQIKPRIASESGDTVWLSWANQSPAWAGTMETVYRELDLSNPQQLAPTTLGATAAAAVISPIAEPIRSPDEVFVTYTDPTAQDAHLANAAAANHPSDSVDSSVGTYNMRSSAATNDDDGGAVAWYAGSSASAFEVYVQPFTYTSSGLSMGSQMNVPLYDAGNLARAPYGPAIVNVGGDIYFVAWGEGPDTTDVGAMGRFIEP